MSNKEKVCVLVPYTTKSACGLEMPYRNALIKSMVTCKACKNTEQYKKMPSKIRLS